jgi:hypothetical protein
MALPLLHPGTESGRTVPVIALAIDPGVTSGTCLAWHDGTVLLVAPDEFPYGLWAMYDLCRAIEGYKGSSHIIYEDFQYRQNSPTRLNLMPVKMIGVIECCAESAKGEIQYWRQTAAQGKAFYSDARLKQLGIYRKGRKHGRDATRHLMQWLTFGAGSQFYDVKVLGLKMVEPSVILEGVMPHSTG